MTGASRRHTPMRVYATTALVRRDGAWKAALFQITPA